MSDMEIRAARGLVASDLSGIRELASICERHDGLRLKLNWGMLSNRPVEQENDFLCYHGEMLVGYLALYGFNRREIEVNGMVHPAHRRRGVFSRLLDRAKTECLSREIPKLLFICDRSSVTAKPFVDSIGARYSFSEYGMELAGELVTNGQTGLDLRFRETTTADAQSLAALDQACFNMSLEEGMAEAIRVRRPDCHGIAAMHGGEMVGKARVLVTHEAALVCGLCVAPEQQGRGFGRALLQEATRVARAANLPVRLEVACNNETALGLYRSCGFQVTTAYDYYELAI